MGFIIIPLVDICKLDSCVLQFWGVFLNDFFDYFLPSLFSVLLLEPLTQIDPKRVESIPIAFFLSLFFCYLDLNMGPNVAVCGRIG